jgi:hypothetical protein
MDVDHRNGNTLSYRMSEVEKDVQELSRKVDRLMWAIVTLAFTIAGAAITFALTAQGLQ